MPFTPKVWEDLPSQATPVDADSLDDLETRLSDYSLLSGGNVFNAIDYGADDTGSTNCLTELQAACSAAESAGGGIVYLPAGSYLIDGVLKINQFVNLRGAGMRETTIKLFDAGSSVLFNEYLNNTPVNSRGGLCGGFIIDGQNLATTCMKVDLSVNRGYFDFRVMRPGANGVALLVETAQNCTFGNFDLEATTATANTTGLRVTDSTGGCRFHDYQTNEFSYAHIHVTQTNSGTNKGVNLSEPRHITFTDGMVERGNTATTCLIRVHSGRDIWFHRQALSLGVGYSSSNDYNLVEVNNSGAGSSRQIYFNEGVSAGGTTPSKRSTAFKLTDSGVYTRITNWQFGNNLVGVNASSGHIVEVDAYNNTSTDTMFAGTVQVSRATGSTPPDISVIGETLDLPTDGTNQATALQTAVNNLESQGGGSILLPNTPVSGSGISLGSRVTFGYAVNIRGQGKRETKLRLTASGAGLYFAGSADPGYNGGTNRGGRSGGFHIEGNNSANICMQVNSANRIFEDIRITTPAQNGVCLKLDNAQNVGFTGFEAEDGLHTSSRSIIGILFDGGAAGCNFYSTSLNEFTNGHVVFDATYDSTEIDYSNNITFVGNMIERTDTRNPIIRILAGDNIRFIGGNISGTSSGTTSAEYDLVHMSNTAARGLASGGTSPTRGLSFYGVTFTGQLNGTTRYANVLRCAADLTSWHKAAYFSPDCGYSNCKYLARIDAGSIVVNAPNQDDSSTGGLTGWSNPLGTGEINTRKQSAAGTIAAKSTVDHYEISGATTITTISATYSGHKITIHFTSTAQVTDGSNIKLNGNFTGGADRVLTLVCDGTNWVEMSRSYGTAHNDKGFIVHGSTAGTARPAGYASVEWQGTVAPTNAITGDTWIDTTP